MSDTISRQQAIEAMRKAKDKSEAHRMLVQLPSVQPETNCSEFPNNSDTINRQLAIDAVESATWYHQSRNGEMIKGANSLEHQAWYKAEDVYRALESVPSAQPEKRTENARKTHGVCLDTISRAAAIDAVAKWIFEVFGIKESDGTATVFKRLRELPPVQPKIIRCKDCKFYGRADKRRFYRGSDCLNKRIDTIVPDRDFCSRAERRTDDKTNKGSSC